VAQEEEMGVVVEVVISELLDNQNERNKLQRNKFMNYELAKQLKDAGFPQKGMFYWVKTYDGDIVLNHSFIRERDIVGTLRQTSPQGGNICYAPTLDELIEACGDEFFRLTNLNGDSDATWHAEAHSHEGGTMGKTRWIAVAKLYLKLNKKS